MTIIERLYSEMIRRSAVHRKRIKHSICVLLLLFMFVFLSYLCKLDFLMIWSLIATIPAFIKFNFNLMAWSRMYREYQTVLDRLMLKNRRT